MPQRWSTSTLGLVLAAILLLAVHAVLTPQMTRRERLVRLTDGVEVSFPELITDLRTARLVFVGELHDQPAHHEAQLRVVNALHELDHPVAIGLEMFRSDSQEDLDRWVAADVDLYQFLPSYYANWNFPWVYYRDIFHYARDHQLPLLGLNVSQEVIRKVARRGFDSLTPEQVGTLPVVSCNVDEEYRGFIRRAMGMHGDGGRAFTNFCEAQLVWDTAMAVNLLEFLDGNPETTVVVIAGSGHAWKRGIPEQIRRLRDVPMRVIVPEIPERLEAGSITIEDADYLWEGLELRL